MIDQPFRYNGEAKDVTGLDYLRARYYDSNSGTFLTTDSYLGTSDNPLSQNRYAYVQNNPVNYVDPSGHIRDSILPAWIEESGGRAVVKNNKKIAATPMLGGVFRTATKVARNITKALDIVNKQFAHISKSAFESNTREGENLRQNWSKALQEAMRHVCEVADYAGDNSSGLNEFNPLNTINYNLEGNLFEWTNQNFFFNSYIKKSVKLEKECKQIICIQNDNGNFSGVQINLFDVVKFSGGVEDGTFNADASISAFGHTGSIGFGVDKDGIGVSAGYSNGKRGYDMGVNIKPDVDKGILGFYMKNHTISQTESGSLVNTVEAGFKTGTWQHAVIVITAGVSIALASRVAAALAGAGTVAIPVFR